MPIASVGEEQSNATALKEYYSVQPNPVRAGESFYIQYPAMAELTILVSDAQGKMVKRERVANQSTRHRLQLTIPGSYLITLQHTTKAVHTFKLIVH